MTKLELLIKKHKEEWAMEKHCCGHCFELGFIAARDMALDEISRNSCLDESSSVAKARYEFIYDNLKHMGDETADPNA